MTFGIVIPTYKREKLITRAINSVLEQTYQNFIICVVNDCSPDNTQEVLKTYSDNDKVHTILLEKNSGVNTARNSALNYLIEKVDYIVFLDDDDYFAPKTLQVAEKQISKYNLNWLGFNRIMPNHEKISQVKNYNSYYNYLKDYYIDEKIKGDICMFINKDIIEDIRFQDNIRAREYLFFIPLSSKADIYMYNFDATICEYLDEGLSFSTYKETDKELNEVRNIENITYKKYFNLTRKQVECMKIKYSLRISFISFNLDRVFRYIKKYIKNSCY